VEQLWKLLPPGGEWTPEDVRSCVASHPDWGRLVDDYVVAGAEVATSPVEERSRRSGALISEAEDAVRLSLEPALALTRCIGVSGSAAFGLAEPNDDLDFFVVSRTGGTWLFLLWAFLAARRAGRRGTRESLWCFNYVVEEGTVDRDFGPPGGLLVAREALSLRIVRGEAYYRYLLSRADWMAAELPRLYAQRVSSRSPPPAEPRLGLLVRAANLVIFPFLAAYVQLSALRRNHRFRRESPDRCFRAETRPGRLQLRTQEFEALREIYESGANSRPT
jgi:hypothetical protein